MKEQNPSAKEIEAAEEWLALEGIEDELLEPIEEDLSKTFVDLGIRHFEDPYEGTTVRTGTIKGVRLA